MPAVNEQPNATYQTLRYEADTEGICTVTLDRPDKLNAIDAQVINELEHAFQAARHDAAVRGVILTGSGERAFAAGADIKQFTELDAYAGYQFALRGQRVFTAIEQMPKPVVAAVNGFALGGGCELALACHLRVAAESAQFGQPEVNLGIIPGYGGTQRLPRLVGHGVAAELVLTGARITAQRAYDIGLVNRVASPEALLATARQLLQEIIGKAPLALTLALRALRAADQALAEGLHVEAALFGQLCSTEDFREGVGAFLEKRSPEFKGR